MAEPTEEVPLAELTPQIVSAYISHHQIGAAELAGLISAVAGQLGRIGSEPEPPAETKPNPAVPVRRSIGRRTRPKPGPVPPEVRAPA